MANSFQARPTPSRYAFLGLLLLCLAVSPAGADTADMKDRPMDVAQLGTLPRGIYLPVALAHTLKAGATPAGTPIEAFTTQRIPVAPHRFLPRGVALHGTVIRSTVISSKQGAGGTWLTLRFTTLHYGNRDVPLRTGALAIANFTNVDDTYAPMTATGDPGSNSQANWTTRQIGGDVLMRSDWQGALLNDYSQRVGFADFNGIYADPPHGSGVNASETDASGSSLLPLALGVFSSTAHGLYGFDLHDTLTSGDGEFTVTAPKHLELRSNDNLLLQVL